MIKIKSISVYINEKSEIYSIGEILESKINGENVIIKSFINHHKRINHKEEYLSVNLQSLKYKTKNFTVPAEHLGIIYIKR